MNIKKKDCFKEHLCNKEEIIHRKGLYSRVFGVRQDQITGEAKKLFN